MSFSWPDYYQIADILYNGGSPSPPCEAAFRSAISRAYYAAFCSVRNHLRAKHGNPSLYGSRGNPHQLIPRYLQNTGNPLASKLGRDLADLREKRNMADYEDALNNPAKEARKALQLAENILRNYHKI